MLHQIPRSLQDLDGVFAACKVSCNFAVLGILDRFGRIEPMNSNVCLDVIMHGLHVRTRMVRDYWIMLLDCTGSVCHMN